MATKDKTIHVRVESSLKSEVEAILRELGFTTSEALYLFLRMVKLTKGIPFEVKIPNEETLERFRRSERGKDMVEYSSIEAAKEALKS